MAPKKEAVWSSVLPLTHLEKKKEEEKEKKFPVVLKQQSKTLS